MRSLPIGASDDQPGRRTHAKTTEADASSGHSTPKGNGELPKAPLEVHNNGMGASGRTEEHNSKDNTDHCGDKSTQDKLRENAADSDLESASGDCLTCSDMEEVAIRSA